MFQLTPEQAEADRADVLDRFYERLTAYLEANVPKRVWRGDAGRARLLRYIDSAERYGLITEEEVFAWVTLCGYLNGDVGELDRPFAVEVANALFDPDRRLDMMDERAVLYIQIMMGEDDR